MRTPTDVWDLPGCMVNPASCGEVGSDVTKGSKAVKNTIDFASDPLGFIAGKMQEAASGLTNDVLPQLVRATSPDFTVAWFVDAYQVSFGVACCLFILLVLRTLVDFGGRRIGSEEVADTLTRSAGMFFLGASFGPVVGSAVVNLFNALTVQIIKWGIGDTAEEMGPAVKRLDDLVRAASPNAISGGAVMAIIVYLLLLIGLLILFLVLIVSFVTLYMSGSVAPIAWAWLCHPETKDRAWKIIRIFIGLVTAKPVAFFMLAIAFKLTAAGLFGVQGGAPKPVNVLVGVLAAAVAMILAGFAPLMLNKFAPIGATEATGASATPRWGGGSSGGGARGGAGASSGSNGQLAQAAMAGAAVSTGGGAGAAVAAGNAAGSNASGSSGGGASDASGGPGGSSFADQLMGSKGGQSGGETSGGDTGGRSDGQTDSGDSGQAQQAGAGGAGSDGQGGSDGSLGTGSDEASGSGGAGTAGLRDAASGSGSGGQDGSSGGDAQQGQGSGSAGGGLGSKLAGAASGLGSATKVGAAGLRSVANKAGSMADQVDEQVDSHIDHAAGHGRRPR